MKSVVIYYSKTGNTEKIAEAIAQEMRTEALPLNLTNRKASRRTREEREAEEALFSQAIARANAADIVILGTPTEFRKPHPRVMEFIDEIEAGTVAIFCTCYGMPGATLIDMEAGLRQRGRQFVGRLALRVGTEQYRFRRDVNQYVEQITEAHLAQAREFAWRCCRKAVEPVELRLWGICGRNCRMCQKYQDRQCAGAGVECWSGRKCQVLECCVIKKSLTACNQCKTGRSCDRRSSILTGTAG